MTTRTTLTLRGDRNQCPGCGELFNSTHAFEMHRKGLHSGNQRKCRDPEEMRAIGMEQRPGGWWISQARTP